MNIQLQKREGFLTVNGKEKERKHENKERDMDTVKRGTMKHTSVSESGYDQKNFRN